MSKLYRLVVAAALTSGALGASAQALQPGLWEINNKLSSSSGEMEKSMAEAQKQLAAMPADQRKMMESMMAKQGGGMPMGAPGGGLGTSVKICMTKEMVERNDVAAQQGDCQHTHMPRTGNTMKFSFVCAKPPSSGEGQVTFVSPQAYTMKMTLNNTVRGKPEMMKMDASGKFLSADCGNIKPPMAPKK